MPRECNCAGPCWPQWNNGDSDENGVTRREFITLLGAGTAGTILAGGPGASGAGAQGTAANPPQTLEQWKRGLRADTPRRYNSDDHRDVRFPLGGIGTGNFELGADGQLTTWQLFNTLRDGYVPLFFGIRAGKTAKLLQTAGGPPGLPRVKRIEMTGEYPVTDLRFEDADLPVKVEMSAFTPFSPLDTPLSSLPVACFVFRVSNPTQEKQTVSLTALMQNPVGYDAMGQVQSFNTIGFNSPERRLDGRHPNFGGNVNEATREGATALLSFRAEAGGPGTLDKPLHIYTNLPAGAFNAPPRDRPQNLTVESLDRLTARTDWAEAGRVIIWLESAGTSLPGQALVAARDAVRAGAKVVFSGNNQPLLAAFANATGGKPLDVSRLPADVVSEDFESGYGKWTVTGEAFGAAPARGTLPNQQNVSGFQGQGLVNSFFNGDDTTGKMVSRPFTIERGYIRFLIGGGNHGATQIRLIVGGRIVRAQSGKNEERLEPALWDVREFRGRSAHIEIVDEQKGGWGHINVDQIEFTDAPLSRAAMEALEELLPARFSAVRVEEDRVSYENLTRREGAATRKANGDTPALVTRTIGKGRTILAQGPVLEPSEAEFIGARRRAYRVLAALVGAKYDAPAGVPSDAPGFGSLALAVAGNVNAAATASVLPAFTDWKAAWETFATRGRFTPLAQARPGTPTPAGETTNGALAVSVTVSPGQSIEVPFLLAWHYPNKYNGAGVAMGNHYATRWPGARTVVHQVAADLPRLRERTERFRKTFYDSTLPYYVLDCVTSQISTIRHIGVVFRIANGDVYGWEGSNGCCQPTCTHVWGYEQSLAYLFPDLERDMRRIDFLHQQRADGGVNNRTEVPSPPRPTGEQPFSDGHSSCILKAYREALNSPDDALFKRYWPNIKRAVEYLIARDAATSGGTPDGTLSDDQWNTYDNAIHGVNTFIGSYYLAALRAGEEWARRVGHAGDAERFHAVFEKGQAKLVEVCWNGEYFQQHLPGYEERSGEYGPGCLSDQVLGQWWAHQLGLGYLLPQDKVRAALSAVVKHNWRTDFTNFQHHWRKFAGGTDKGLLICSWPRGGRPANTIPYVDEVWTGIEYQVAAHLIYEGMLDEALAVIKGARDRYDGIPRPPMPRNPWNEIECGGHYARALSSWSVLLALSGFAYDGPAQSVRFAPRLTPEKYKAFFTGPEGWGNVRQTRTGNAQENEFAVTEGRFLVKELRLFAAAPVQQVQVTVGGRNVPATLRPSAAGAAAETLVVLETALTVRAGGTLTVRLS